MAVPGGRRGGPRAMLASLLAVVASVSVVAGTSCDFDGGWAMRDADGCPDYTNECTGGIVSRCCAADTYCWTTNTAYCCPTNTTDCWEDILNVPKVGRVRMRTRKRRPVAGQGASKGDPAPRLLTHMAGVLFY